eukprot:146334-Chlamydomonas_euryale.AAC.3
MALALFALLHSCSHPWRWRSSPSCTHARTHGVGALCPLALVLAPMALASESPNFQSSVCASSLSFGNPKLPPPPACTRPLLSRRRAIPTPVAQNRTYPDLLRDEHDAALFDHFGTSRLVRVDVESGAVDQGLGLTLFFKLGGKGPRDERRVVASGCSRARALDFRVAFATRDVGARCPSLPGMWEHVVRHCQGCGSTLSVIARDVGARCPSLPGMWERVVRHCHTCCKYDNVRN